jgi:hypothetical protein
MATNKTKPDASKDPQRITVKLARRLAFTTFVFAILVVAAAVAAVVACLVGLRDPDICWILAIGRFITSHNALSFIDPFSSNLSTDAIVGRNLPLMQYQWLVEILFFKMMLCQNNWRQLMKDYKIAYVLARVFMPITQTLAKDPEWKTIYRDQDAMVLVKL